MHPSVAVAEVGEEGPIAAAAVLDAIAQVRPSSLVLAEAGPRLMGDFLAERVLDELFLTLAPQVAGRDGSVERPGLVAGKRFAPDDPRWSSLVKTCRRSTRSWCPPLPGSLRGYVNTPTKRWFLSS